MRESEPVIYHVGTRRAFLDYPPDERRDWLKVECANPAKTLVIVYEPSEHTLKLESR